MRTRDLFTSLEKQNTPYTPFSFVESFRKAYPNFNQMVKSERGDIQAQQDADEFLNSLLSTLRSKSKEIDSLFKGEFEITFNLTEGKEEPTVVKETFHKISCHIDQQTTNLEYSISQSLNSQIEKNSTLLGKSAIYTKKSKFSHLPQYLCVNEVRFFWKAKEQIKTKMLRDVKFPIILDLFDHCTEDLKKVLGPNRQTLRTKREKEILNKFKQEDKMIEEEKPIVEIANGNSTGWYELCGVVTHKGRSADSGHYLGWVKEEDGRWIRYDDDVVTEVTEEDITKLSGGGDWHIAYILFYRSKANGKFVQQNIV
jgi:ubiquitin carboxyl-terminal hydrolase 14